MNIINKIQKTDNIGKIIMDFTADDLEAAIKIAANSYYNRDESLITDEQYDMLVERLKLLRPDSELLTVVGHAVKGKKVKLPYWLGSMDKLKDENQINKWIQTYTGPYVVSDKLDGISCSLVMTKKTIQLNTRGDGAYGLDVTHLLDYVNMHIDHLTSLKNINKVAIRGELIMTKRNFEKYTQIRSNARNMVAGIVTAKPSSLNADFAADVDFIAYEIMEPVMSPSEQMEQLIKWKLNTVYYDVYDTIDKDTVNKILASRKKRSKYEIDGIIVTDDNEHGRNKSGNPPYSFAYKGETPTANVKVTEIYWKPSKDGIIVPTIVFESVRLSQVDIDHTYGFNAKFIKKNKIGPGAVITIRRSGDTIPYILNVVKSSKINGLPTNYEFTWDKNNVNIVLADPENDTDVIISRLTRFVTTIGVNELSEGLIAKLVDRGYVDITDLISITYDDLLEIDGFQKRLATKIYNNLQASLKNLDLLNLMVGSNYFGRGFGKRKIKKILDSYPNIVTDYNRKKSELYYYKINELEGFNDITTRKFLDALPKFQKLYNQVTSLITVRPYKKIVAKHGRFDGMAIVFTGFRKKEWVPIIESEGGEFKSDVSKKTTLLVYLPGSETSSYKKAQTLGIKMMTREEFAKKFKL